MEEFTTIWLPRLVEIISWACILAGSLSAIISGIGLIRFPDFYTRMHAASIADTAGIGLLMLGMMLQEGLTIVTIKLVLILAFIFFTSPASTHALAHVAFENNVKPLLAGKDGKGQDKRQGDDDATGGKQP